MNKSTWLITAKTNLHVGDESSTGYGLIDKSIQRDALTRLPCINASSLKGSVKEYCTYSKHLESDKLMTIFGSDKRKEETPKKGTTLFFDAGLLFLPVQDDECLYKLAYCDDVLNKFIELSKLFGAENITKEAIFAKFSSKKFDLKEYKEFEALCQDDELPIIARNKVENGESQNLWYEQILPAETVFYTFTQAPDTILEETINDEIIQIGANATIGYGYCKFLKL